MELITQDKRKKYKEGYKQHRKNVKYDLNYYHSNKKEIECPYCKKLTCNLYLNKVQILHTKKTRTRKRRKKRRTFLIYKFNHKIL